MEEDDNIEKEIDLLFGSFISDKTAEQIIEDISNARVFNRQNEAF
jgi:hypothetical protein